MKTDTVVSVGFIGKGVPNKAVQRAIFRLGMIATSAARRQAPYDTGNLHGNIEIQEWRPNVPSIAVYSAVNYSAVQERRKGFMAYGKDFSQQAAPKVFSSEARRVFKKAKVSAVQVYREKKRP